VHRDGRPEHFEALLVARIERLRGRFAPLVVALDGRSGSGKSTLATAVAARIGAVVIDGDDFYGGGSAEAWDAMTPAERADRCIDWRRQRPVLEALGHGRPASWRAYDWGADNGRLVERSTLGVPATLVILEGVDSARPELADLVDLTVLLDIPDSVRTARIAQRAREHFEPEWAERWASAEAWYFGKVMPPSAFDLRRSQNGSVSWAGAPREVSTTSPLLAGGSVAEPRGRGRPPDVLNCGGRRPVWPGRIASSDESSTASAPLLSRAHPVSRRVLLSYALLPASTHLGGLHSKGRAPLLAEDVAARGTAEHVGYAFVFERDGGLIQRYGHAADRVGYRVRSNGLVPQRASLQSCRTGMVAGIRG
jgi:uridine kinase